MKNLIDIQKKCCENYGSPHLPCESNQLVVVCNGVLKGKTQIEGVRYPSPIHMTGWWLTTDDYDGNVDSLKNIHYKHIVKQLPQIAIYLGLPYGYRFLLGGDKEHVWFDENINEVNI